VNTSELLAGKVALVTGAAGGLGHATATAFAREGCKIALVDRDADAVRAVQRDLASSRSRAPDDFVAIPADVADGKQVSDYYAVVLERWGRLDVLFNNAGIEGTVTPVHEYEEDVFDRVIQTNLKGVFLNLKFAVRAMLHQRSGSVINTSSGAGLAGLAMLSAYAASKHGVIGLTRTAAIELAPLGIRVNAICPGPVATRMMASLELQISGDGTTLEDARANMTADVPMGRYGTPEEIAELVAFLASDRAAFITGAAIAIDGGRTAG
jgi:NAD(P)-dependent dehydrogenase (short-subunit alcohol dehydrogenase family)